MTIATGLDISSSVDGSVAVNVPSSLLPPSCKNTTVPAATFGTAAATVISPEVVIVKLLVSATAVTTPTTSAFAALLAWAFANALLPLALTTFTTDNP